MLTRPVMAIWFGRGPVSRVLAALLIPFSVLTRWHSMRARAAIARHAPPQLPVLVVGNLLVGGTGKTPLVVALARALAASGLGVGLVCSGYGARRQDARLVRAEDEAGEQGDEAVLLASESGLPVAAGRRRDQALECLLAAYPGLDLVISDDGLQHQHLARTVELVVFDRRGLGNGLLLPAGPLREALPADGQLSAIAVNDAPAPRGVRAAHTFGFRIRALGLAHMGSGETLSPDAFRTRHSGQALCALAGIGEPTRFFDTLEEQGIHPTHRLALADHARISASDLAAIPEPLIVMTAKDAVKCRGFADDRCWILRVEAEPDPQLLIWLQGALLGNKTA